MTKMEIYAVKKKGKSSIQFTKKTQQQQNA